VSDAPIAANITQTGNILRNLPSQLAAHDVIAVNNLSYPAKLILRQFAGFRALINSGFLQNLPGRVFAYTTYIGQRNPYRLVIGNINTNYTRHINSSYPKQ
jgi:hypothetical protein